MKNSLKHNFYNRNAVIVAKELLGKKLVFGHHEGIITETEAYRGSDDEASHACKRLTERNAVMFGQAGYCYIYLIYGIHYCLNISTEEIGQPSAVLIRGVLLPNNVHLNGPGKLCKHFGFNRSHNGLSLLNNNEFYICNGIQADRIITTPRIGITKAVEKPWRFLLII